MPLSSCRGIEGKLMNKGSAMIVGAGTGAGLMYLYDSLTYNPGLGHGDSWVVPKGALHRYTILEPFTAVEATYPPAHVHGRDEA
jgi:hypothetical protein